MRMASPPSRRALCIANAAAFVELSVANASPLPETAPGGGRIVSVSNDRSASKDVMT